MDDQPERAIKAATTPMGMGTPFMAVAAPVGAVGRRDRERAGRTSLQREGPASLLLRTALPGSAILQRRGVDGTWETLDTRSASRLRRTRIELPQGAASSPTTFRVVFSPRNTNITSWVSDNIDG